MKTKKIDRIKIDVNNTKPTPKATRHFYHYYENCYVKKVSKNLRNLLIEYLQTDHGPENIQQDLLFGLEQLFEFLDGIEDEQKHFN